MAEAALPIPSGAPRDLWPAETWPESPPETVGINPVGLASAQEHMATHYPHLTSLLIVRGGRLVFEYYQGQADSSTRHNLKSVTKSVLSLLVGIALKTGDLAGLDEPLGHLLPHQFTSISASGKRAITVRDLLTMRAGLDWAEWGDNVVGMTASRHWLRYVLERPLVEAPGTVFTYSTGVTQLLSVVLQTVTGMTALDYADLLLFGPLGIKHRDWPADPQGITIGGTELSLTARDMAKIGLLVLSGGQWQDRQIVPADWVRASLTPHVTVTREKTSSYPPVSYGYLWWLRPLGEYAGALAAGYGGQYIYLIPALDLGVVITASLRSIPKIFTDHRMVRSFNLVEKFIVPAVDAR